MRKQPAQPLDLPGLSPYFLLTHAHPFSWANKLRRLRKRLRKMPQLVNKLTARRIAAITAAAKPGYYGDGRGLYLVVAPGGSASWICWYRHGGKRRKMGLGSERIVSLAEARAKRDEAHKTLRLDRKDPLAHRAARRAKQAAAMTFAEAARRYIAATTEERSNPKSLAQWHMTLLGEDARGRKTKQNYCASMHDVPVGEIDTRAVLDVLEPIWKRIPETASRLRGRIEAVIDWAMISGHCGDVVEGRPNPARWDNHLEHVLVAKGKVREVKHHAALPYADVPAFMAALATREGAAARSLELAILTAVRTGDLLGSDREERPPMRWEHVDLEARTWTIPKTKTNVSHKVPLSDAAVALLERVRREHPDDGSGIVFVGDRRGQPLSNGAMLRVRDRMIADGLLAKGALTPHGVARASFKSWASAVTGFEKDVIEACLTHVISDPLEAAYRRDDFIEKRRLLMAAWANFVMGKEDAGNVIALHAAPQDKAAEAHAQS
jgi:integrase